jgi:hypothetical protein
MTMGVFVMIMMSMGVVIYSTGSMNGNKKRKSIIVRQKMISIPIFLFQA